MIQVEHVMDRNGAQPHAGELADEMLNCGDEWDAQTCPETRKIVLETIVSDVFAISFRDLRRASRGRAHVALARQVAMYLAHVQFGLTLTDVGRVFSRDRTTVAHACAVVEDRRDDASFDYVLELLERIVNAYENPRPNLLAFA